MAGWHHRLNGHESEWTPGDGDEQGGLACCNSWGHKELDTTERLNWTELNWFLFSLPKVKFTYIYIWHLNHLKHLTFPQNEVKWSESCSVMSDSCDPMDSSLPGSSVHGNLQARILEWVAISFSRASSQPRNRTQVSCIAGRFFTNWAMGEAHRIASIE